MTSREVEQALTRSAVYGALAQAFGPPDEDNARRLGSVEGWEHLRAALLALDVAAPRAPRELALDLPALGRRYQDLFGHTVRGVVTAFETEYGSDGMLLQPHLLADLGAFFAAFGLAIDPASGQRPDHVQCECEFLAFLARKEAFAIENGDTEMMALTRDAQRKFLREHLGRFAPAFGALLGRADRDGYYGALGRVLSTFVSQDCRGLGVDAGGEELALRLEVDDETPIACGTPGGTCPT